MLNELHQAAEALNRAGATVGQRHPALEPMGKNARLLLIGVDGAGRPTTLEILPGETAGRLNRVRHASRGSSFPGFNLPGPLFLAAPGDQQAIAEALAQPGAAGAAGLAGRAEEWVARSRVRPPSAPEEKQFGRSTSELVGWLRSDFAGAGPEFTNFSGLLDAFAGHPPGLQAFSSAVAALLAKSVAGRPGAEAREIARWLFQQKGKQRFVIPVFLHLAAEDTSFPAAADARMSELINCRLLAIGAREYSARGRAAAAGSFAAGGGAADAFSGRPEPLAEVFPTPKLAILGPVRLFSNNSRESPCLRRYGLEGAAAFPVAAAAACRLSDALAHLASEARLGQTCQKLAVGGEKPGLLVAYLEAEPDAPEAFAELFGAEADSYADPDFAAATKPVLDALDARAAANPNQLVRLFVLAGVDPANTQAAAHRALTVSRLATAARVWQNAARARPWVTAVFYDRQRKANVNLGPVVPSPAETAAILNRIWTGGRGEPPESARQVAFTAARALDLFIGGPAVQRSTAALALTLLLCRAMPLFGSLGRYRATRQFGGLPDRARWLALKSCALLRLLLAFSLAGSEDPMDTPVFQVGRLLALADSLHFQYCKWVRSGEEQRAKGGVQAPGELLGNALFNYALDHPTAALARLAERIKPYQAWARTYSGPDAGLVHWLCRQMGGCQPDLDRLPARMRDRDKAGLLLGYLADIPKSSAAPGSGAAASQENSL